MALAIEGIKPLAVSAGLAAWRSGEWALALPLTLLAGISVAYSLGAELSLVSQTRGDQAAERQAQANDAGTIQRSRQRIEAELAQIGITRPAKVLSVELNALLADPRLKDCKAKLDNWRLDAICTDKVTPLRSELALAERREALEGQLNGGQTIPAKDADPGSTALSTYLAALGLPIPAAVVAQWLILIPVLALEIGSALAHVLVQAFPREVKTDGVQSVAQPVVQPEDTASEATRERVKKAVVDQVSTKVVDHLKASGGTLSSGERGLAKLIGSNRGTMKRALNALTLAGIVSLEASRNGTILRLMA
jgi:hypothetical protein